ncbi:MAG: NAD(P)H-dependent oxidoreductase subunit E [Planctomycetota bacterium]
MSKTEQAVKDICKQCGNDPTRMMDIVRGVQAALGSVDGSAMETIAKATNVRRVDVQSTVSFYAFLSSKPNGKIVIRLCDDIIDDMNGGKHVGDVLKEELGIDFGETTKDGITLTRTPCIGMSDQGPAMMVNDQMITYLGGDHAREIIGKLRQHMDPAKLAGRFGDGNNANDLVRSMVHNNIRKGGEVIFAPFEAGAGLKKAVVMTPVEVIRDIKTARLRGRGGAGFPTGMKWEFTHKADGDRKFVICNADEGEPGTFKDRAILTECADLMFEGMTIAGYAIGAEEGILYLRGEYAYLQAFLEQVLADRRKNGLLGKKVCGKEGFSFDIRIQMGAGAYVCGEETALISSCEGLRGDPKNRPPFPAQKGYLGQPTSVNNVETFCCAARILQQGPGWFAQTGSSGSPGTKLLSVSGDCNQPGVYEVPFGIKLSDVLHLCGAEDAAAVQVGGPSGQLIGPADFERTVCYDDLATGGSVMIFNSKRDVLEIVEKFLDFFVEESCGYCTPCRVGNVLLKNRIRDIRAGHGEPADIEYLETLGASIKTASRCGLGQTSANPVLSTLKNFRPVYEALLREPQLGRQPTFDLEASVGQAEAIAGRKSVHAES